MTTTTAAQATPPTVARRAGLGTAGAALWVLLPVAWGIAELGDQEYGSLAFVAVAASYWIFAVLPPVLLVVGHTALRASLGTSAGRLGAAGILLASSGLGGMALGNGIEVGSMTAGGDEVALGHAIFLTGFLVSIVGGVLVGVTVIRRRSDALSRAAGWILALALPLGLGIGFLGSVTAPENDAAFWAAIAVPTGAAWLLLGRALTATDTPASR
jgi:hypothetical protein